MRVLLVEDDEKIIHGIFADIHFFIPHYPFEEVFTNKCQVEDNGEQFQG